MPDTITRPRFVRYHGSLTSYHGDGWTLVGECACDECEDALTAYLARPDRDDVDPPTRYELVNPAIGRTLSHVRGESFTPLTATNQPTADKE